MNITLLAAMDQNGAIGKEGQLPWKVKGDMVHFVKYTTGTRKVLVMGRKTYDSLPEVNGVKLPGRFKIVLSSNLSYENSKDPFYISTWEDLRSFLGSISSITDEVIVIGGESMYQQFLPLANKLVLTRFKFSVPDCDKFFPGFDERDYQYHSSEVLSPETNLHIYKRFDL